MLSFKRILHPTWVHSRSAATEIHEVKHQHRLLAFRAKCLVRNSNLNRYDWDARGTDQATGFQYTYWLVPCRPPSLILLPPEYDTTLLKSKKHLEDDSMQPAPVLPVVLGLLP